MRDDKTESDTTPHVGASDTLPVTVQASGRSISRRALVRAAGIALPTIATLHSGAALAQSSNLLGTVQDVNPERGKYRCLDTSSVYRTKNPNVFDLGEDPMAHVTRIRSDKDYYVPKPDGLPSSNKATPKEMCKKGGDYLRKDGNSHRLVKVRKGALVSAAAMNSFSRDITLTDI